MHVRKTIFKQVLDKFLLTILDKPKQIISDLG